MQCCYLKSIKQMVGSEIENFRIGGGGIFLIFSVRRDEVLSASPIFLEELLLVSGVPPPVDLDPVVDETPE